MFTTSHKPLAPGRVRCRCCRQSMQRLKRATIQAHYDCMCLHITRLCDNPKHPKRNR